MTNYKINNIMFTPNGDTVTVAFASEKMTISTDKARLMYREQQEKLCNPLQSGIKIESSLDYCPQHNTELKKEYSFGCEDARVFTYSGCKCAVCNTHESTYYTSYAEASSAAKMQSARMSAW